MRTAAIARGSRDAAGMPPPVPVSEQGPSSRRVIVGYGFWLFLLSDIILFSTFFAAYAVLAQRNAGGPVGTQLFHRDRVLLETACLLASSFTCGIFSLAVDVRRRGLMLVFALLTFALGAVFLGIELAEFADMIGQGAGPGRSAFLSAFFALVGLHGLHVTIGLAWLVSMVAQVYTLGWRPFVLGRLVCFALFWHALDIVWIGVFTIVYLGAR
ncbi:MAG: cytochrome c oxidase subunit 3 [Burkholderiaceae bacterium]